MAERKLPDDPVAFVRECLRGGRILWTYHVNMRLGQRFITRETIIAAVESYEIVEAYPGDKYFPSYLLLGKLNNEAFHVLFGADVEGQKRARRHGLLPQPGRVGRRSQDHKETPNEMHGLRRSYAPHYLLICPSSSQGPTLSS